MTKSELYAVWTRWAHRQDLSPDYDTIYELAGQRIADSAMRVMPPEELDEILATSPAVWLQAGLVELFQLSRNNQAIMEADARFVDVLGKYLMQWSLTNTKANPWEFNDGT